MTRHLLTICLVAGAAVLFGCGGNDLAPVSPTPGPPADVATHEVGPLVIRTASAAGFVAEDISTNGAVSLVALYGSTIEYLASQAMLDRIVFSYGGASPDIWVCNLDGSHRVQLTDNAAEEQSPRWSPDGTMVVFERWWQSQEGEIMLMNADGSGIHALTNNTSTDAHPSFGPVGRRIAFAGARDGNFEVYTMFRDGSSQVNITNHAGEDTFPDWSPQFTDPIILFCSRRDATEREIYRMYADGSAVTRLTDTPLSDDFPRHDPTGGRMAYRYGADVFVRAVGSGPPYDFSASPGVQTTPSWSSDGRFICYTSNASGGDTELVLQEAHEPYSKFALTHNSAGEWYPDLGSPTLQTDRVLIGPARSDWGGNDPIWSSAYAAIAAFSTDGYENLVRIGISPAHVGSLQISPLSQPAAGSERPAGVVVEATKIANLREDAGRGLPPKVWDLAALNLTAALLYFDPDTGRLISVLALDDASYPSAAGSPPAVTEQADGSGMLVTGRFAAAFDASGNRIAGPSSRVSIGADGAVSAME